jgi:hypothetical protein
MDDQDWLGRTLQDPDERGGRGAIQLLTKQLLNCRIISGSIPAAVRLAVTTVVPDMCPSRMLSWIACRFVPG